MKQIFFSVFLVSSMLSFAGAQTTPLSSNLFIQKAKETDKAETYQCIQIRRGDKITLTGYIKFAENKTEPKQKVLSFTSLGGRLFLLKGEHLQKLTDFIKTNNSNLLITIKGIVLFEGLEDMPAKLEVVNFKHSDLQSD